MPLKTLNTLLRVVVEQGYPLERDRDSVGHTNVLLMMYRFYSWLIDRGIRR